MILINSVAYFLAVMSINLTVFRIIQKNGDFMPVRLFLTTCLFFTPHFALSAVEGVIMVAKGKVSVKSKSETVLPAKVGTKVSQGDTVITGPDSRAKIVMQDRNVMNVSPDSELKIVTYTNDSEAKKVELNLIKGKVRNNVEQVYEGAKSNFMIKTPTAVAGVRGTQFVTSYDPSLKLTKLVTLKGAVQFSVILPNGQLSPAVIINKGQTSKAVLGEQNPDKPTSVPKEELQKVDSESISSTAVVPETNLNQSEPPKKSSTSTDSSETATPERANSPPPSMITSGDVGTQIGSEVKDYRGADLPKSGDARPPKQDRPKGPATDLTNIIRDKVGKTKVIVNPQ
jgi:hypothetical protein